jgi:hypothetical protein
VKPHKIPKIEQTDVRQHGAYHRWLKRAKVRAERRRAKAVPDCVPAYGRYQGYET